MKKILLVCCGSLTLALGVIGIFIPVLPTTPFLLLASFCYLKSSKRLYAWLMNHKVLGEYIDNYLTHKAIRKDAKIVTMILLWLSLGLTIILSASIHLKLALAVVGIGVSIHILKLKTIRKDSSQD